MTPERWQRIKAIYEQADLLLPADRLAVLDRLCAGDPDLRRQVNQLLTEQGDGTFVHAAIGAQAASLQRLSPGAKLGPYEILSLAGAGGMGEVYRARDTRLERTVAIKVLRHNLTRRADVLQRFEREARAIATLNHPNMCTLYDVGTHEGKPYLVMEYLEGETLATRLARGPVPLADAYRVAIQIGNALDQAHAKNIVHRDLKPGNVMLVGAKGNSTVKLLDFGLAKLSLAQAAAVGSTTQDLTMEGAILGTLQYMSPEQLEGKEADARSDIFAFGTLLFETITGRKPFEGDSQASLISAIMKDDPPPVSAIQSTSTPTLDRLIHQCLAKDPEDRWQTVRDLVRELRWISESSPPPAVAPLIAPRRKWRVGAASIAAVVFAVAFAAVATVHFGERPPAPRTIRFVIAPPEGSTLRVADIPVLSPDGARFVFSLSTLEGDQLAVRALNDPTIRMLPDTTGAVFPFWSADGSEIAFNTSQGLKKVSLAGGRAVTICNPPMVTLTGSWNRQGVILLGGPSGLMRVSSTGGTLVNVTKVDPSRGETFHRSPFFLPDDRHFLFTVNSSRSDVRGIYVGDLNSPQTVRLLGDETNAQYSPPGFLLFARGDVLHAQPFDADRLQLGAVAFPLPAKPTRFDLIFSSVFSTAAGELIYATGPNATPYQMVWIDRKGIRLSTVGAIAEYANPALSPDGRTLAVGIRDETTKKRDIWLFDLVRGTERRLTFEPGDDLNPVWSPDGRQIVFTSRRNAVRDLYRKAADGTGQEELLLESRQDKHAEDWTRDGKYLLYNSGASRQDIWAVDLSGKVPKPTALLTGPFSQNQARVSPDGHWLAYSSNDSGKWEVYVQTFPPTGGKWQISTSGGREPQWRNDGKELFYVQNEKTLMAVEIASRSGRFEAGIPKPLFDAPFMPVVRNRFIVTPDGRKFLAITRVDQASPRSFTFVLNWAADTKR